MANTKVTRSQSTAGNRNKWTFSAWVKRALTGAEEVILSVYYDASYYTEIGFTAGDQINFFDLYNGALNGRRRTNALARDCNGWWHIVGVFDKDNSTTDEKIRLWVNGVKIEGALAAQQQSSINYSSNLNSAGQTVTLGAKNNASYFNGIMSHVHFCDGYAYDASYFGSTDSTTGEWKINTSPSVSYGTQGYHILKDGNSVTDQSPNTNNFTVGGGTLTNTEDSPSNNFAILNSITPSSNNNRAGGTRHFNNSGTYDMRHSTLAVSKGKYYAEFKITQMSGGFTQVGIQDTTQFDDYSFMTNSSRGYGYLKDGNKRNASSISSYGDTFTTGDIIGVAVDLDNNKLYFSKNGVWQNSGDPTSGATGTGSAFDITDGYDYCIATSSNDAGTDQETDVNFGNGYFGTTAVSSAGTNASGNGIFEYDVPTGYTALSTKGLNL